MSPGIRRGAGQGRPVPAGSQSGLYCGAAGGRGGGSPAARTGNRNIRPSQKKGSAAGSLGDGGGGRLPVPAAGRVGPLFSKPVGHGSAGYGPRCGDPGEPPGTGDGDPAPERCGQCVAGGIFRPGKSVGYGLRRTGRSGRPKWLLAGRGRRLLYGGERGYPMEAAHGDPALGAAGDLYGYYVAGPSGNAPEHSSSGKPAPVFHP